MILRPLKYITAAIIALTTQGCFTGVESTPRISDSELRREIINRADDANPVADITPQPYRLWQPGKKFIVTDPKSALVLNTTNSVAEPYSGMELRYEATRWIISPTGDSLANILFSSSRGPVSFDTGLTPEKLRHPDIKVSIPYVTEQSVVDSLSARLTGKDYYILTSTRFDTSHTQRRGPKFQPVRLIGVSPGTGIYPATLTLVTLTAPTDTILLDLSLSNRNDDTRTFNRQLSSSNPRDRYPSISSENWQHIIRSNVVIGMTRDECRLALGTPADVARYSYPANYEIWTYPEGVRLQFTDGILTKKGRK